MGLIPDDKIREVIDRTDIVDVVSDYVSLKKAGRNFKGLSPFNTEKTPSFVVSPDKQIFHCFSSGQGGNAISFIMKMEKVSFPEAVRLLAQKVNVLIEESNPQERESASQRHKIFEINKAALNFYHKVLVTDKGEKVVHAREYLKGRGFDLETVNQFQLGYSPDRWDALMIHLSSKGYSLEDLELAGLIVARQKKDGFYDRFRDRLMFPIFDSQGNCRAFGARALDPEVSAKYINSPETFVYTKGQYLYGFHMAKQHIAKDDFAVVVEGYTDCIMPFQAGIQNIVASLGTALTVEQIRLIRRYTKNICLLYDTDKAGMAAMMRSLDTLIEEGLNVKVATLEEGEDPDSFIRQKGPEKFCERILNAETLFDYKVRILKLQHDVKTVEGKSEIAHSMLETIRMFSNAVQQAGYIRRLAMVLNIPEQALITEMNKVAGSKTKNEEPARQKFQQVKREQLRAVETSLLRLIIDEQKFITKMREDITLADFQETSVRGVISKIYDLFDSGETVTTSQLLNNFESEESQQVVSSILADSPAVADKEKFYADCINRIKSDKLKAKRQDLLSQIKLAEMQGNEKELEMLKAQFNEIIKK